jgi:hypothetical protein
MTQAQMIAKAVKEVLASQGILAKGALKAANSPKGKVEVLASKDKRIVSAFKRKGIAVTLMNRADPTADFDVRPYKGWLAQGRIVSKGQHGVQGLFHVSQTEELPQAAE